ncbi:hypothetical protein I552_6025 [Mycobacterium xenopi 3993]|nr:hypothetical protein I552_6025 [Mycobacterium xenopi 3993]
MLTTDHKVVLAVDPTCATRRATPATTAGITRRSAGAGGGAGGRHAA